MLLLIPGQLAGDIEDLPEFAFRPGFALGLVHLAEEVVEGDAEEGGRLGDELGRRIFGGAFIIGDGVARGVELARKVALRKAALGAQGGETASEFGGGFGGGTTSGHERSIPGE